MDARNTSCSFASGLVAGSASAVRDVALPTSSAAPLAGRPSAAVRSALAPSSQPVTKSVSRRVTFASSTLFGSRDRLQVAVAREERPTVPPAFEVVANGRSGRASSPKRQSAASARNGAAKERATKRAAAAAATAVVEAEAKEEKAEERSETSLAAEDDACSENPEECSYIPVPQWISKANRRTKVVCTLGPKTCDYESIKALAERGMSVARLNMSHGEHAWHAECIRRIKRLNQETDHSIAILLDTKGPEVRSGDLKAPIELKAGDRFTFTATQDFEHETHAAVNVSYDGFVYSVRPGDIILVDGGLMSFKVIEKREEEAVCEVLDGGMLTSRRHLNIRGKSAKLPSITSKDWQDIEFGIEHGVDFFALSFVKHPEVVRDLQEYLQDRNVPIAVIAKIESADAVTCLDEILQQSDGAMVARGDLGSEIPIEEVPLVQERIVETCRRLGKPVIVATHLLESMILYPTPTRAEVTDIAEAVKMRADSLMLSGETAGGKYPLRALETMASVAARIEERLRENKIVTVQVDTSSEDERNRQEIVRSATIMANNLSADAILVFTRRGTMASLVSRCRPNAPIHAFTNTTHTRRRLNLYFGVHPWRIAFSSEPEKTITRAMTHLARRGLLRPGAMVVIVSDILAGDEFVHTIQVREAQ
eukprot:tig00000144_g9029.t1